MLSLLGGVVDARCYPGLTHAINQHEARRAQLIISQLVAPSEISQKHSFVRLLYKLMVGNLLGLRLVPDQFRSDKFKCGCK